LQFKEDVVVTGTFGGVSGWLVKPNDFISQGYMFCPDEGEQDTITYWSPTPMRPFDPMVDQHTGLWVKNARMVGCLASSNKYGVGRGVGVHFNNDTLSFSQTMFTFDDNPDENRDVPMTYAPIPGYEQFVGTNGIRPEIQIGTIVDGFMNVVNLEMVLKYFHLAMGIIWFMKQELNGLIDG